MINVLNFMEEECNSCSHSGVCKFKETRIKLHKKMAEIIEEDFKDEHEDTPLSTTTKCSEFKEEQIELHRGCKVRNRK